MIGHRIALVTYRVFEDVLALQVMTSADGTRSQVPRLLHEYRAGRLNLADLVTRTYRLEDIDEAYDDMLEGRVIRGLIVYDESDY
ncbi:hypothetical protein [Streptomyces carpinensis]|uniref:Alcohol dehydrogenase n=1 Tax=Streptomyces carpinensis TaxID=66369 RepID=A0ABV1VW52_9ACTN|nr:hypothetical protein [Streptomyces carpinensis]